MKTREQLEKLAKNPFYKLSHEEEEFLTQTNEIVAEEDPKKKANLVPKGNAAVKRIGKLEKHQTDPVAEK